MNIDASPAIALAMEDAVMRSFRSRPLPIRGITEAECRRRVRICEEIWRALRVEKRWSVQRVCDHIYRFLIATLDGMQWEPSERSIWVPDDPTSANSRRNET